ncbi:MAG: radical SAM protein [Candidatus Omnitrophota bacterium]|jgi:radical SAM protein with 4Fe4S-binding SPASM domain
MTIKKGDSNNFYADINTLARKHKIPSRVMFELTYKCNFRCIHCYVAPDKRKKELTTAQVFLILDQLKTAGSFHIGFTGGEPLLREDIFDILDYAKNCGFRISILTNGSLINKDTAKRIASLGTSLNRVDISVLGSTKKTFEKITGKTGSFELVMKAVKSLKKEGVDVQIKATLLSLNKNEFLDIKKLAERQKCLFRYDPSVTRKADGSKSPLRYQVELNKMCRIKGVFAADRTAVNEDVFSELKPKAVGRKKLFHCGAGQSEVTISPYGEMNFCPEIHYPGYNILKISFNDCWGKLKKLVRKIEIPKKYQCNTCALAVFCHWCPARAWLLKKDFFTCDEESKKMALAEAGFNHGMP